MATRPSDTIMILKIDLKSGAVEKKIFNDLIEYWIYDSRDRGSINLQGQLAVVPNAGTGELKFIVVCENSPKHIRTEHPNHFVVSGVIFSNRDTADLDEYLQKTGRPK